MPRTPSPKRRRKQAKTAVDVHRHPGGATAVQVDTGDGQVVVCDSLRVLITKQDGAWLAQGLEIDYAIDGETIADVKKRFQTGLAMTIESNLRVHGNIRDLLRIAPQDRWASYFDTKHALHRFTHSQVMIRQLQTYLPFDQIMWLEKRDAA